MIKNLDKAVALGRRALNFSQSQFAERLGFSTGTICRIESGDTAVKIKTINKVFDFFTEKGVDFVFENNKIVLKIKIEDDKNVRQH